MGRVERATLSADGGILVTLSKQITRDKSSSQFEWTVQGWDSRIKELPPGPPLKRNSMVTQIAVSPGGNHVITYSPSLSGSPLIAGGASCTDYGEANLWRLRTGDMFPLNQAGAVTHAAFSPDGQYLVTASADPTARVWELMGRPVSPPLQHAATINHVAISSNGLVATSSNDGSARALDLTTGYRRSPRR